MKKHHVHIAIGLYFSMLGGLTLGLASEKVIDTDSTESQSSRRSSSPRDDEEIVISKAAALKQIKLLLPTAIGGDTGGQKKIRDLRRTHKVTDRELGIEHSGSKDTNKIHKLAEENRLAAIQHIPWGYRWLVPTKTRQGIFDKELEQCENDEQREQTRAALTGVLRLPPS